MSCGLTIKLPANVSPPHEASSSSPGKVFIYVSGGALPQKLSSTSAAENSSTMAQRRLLSELVALQKEKWLHLEVDDANLFVWKVGLMVVNPESVFNGGYFKAVLDFPPEYPYQPPKFRFTQTSIYHPNIYANGELCISILHEPGEDEQSGELACERWSPLQGVESVLRSILLLLDNPETNSPANVDASILYRTNRALYNKSARIAVALSEADMPPGFSFPTVADLVEDIPETLEDDDFWNKTDGELDFDSGSDDDDELDDRDDDADD